MNAQNTALTTGVNNLKVNLNGRMSALKNFLGSEQKALRFMSAVTLAVQKNPDLITKCNPESLLGAFMECASLDMYPSNHSGDCYIVPYKGYAQFQIGYRGFKTLAFRAGILRIGSDVVREKDEYKEERGTDPKIIHNVPLRGERGEAYRAYAWAEITKGNTVFQPMSKEEIMEIKETSPAKNSNYSPWNGNDPQLWMWQKTCLKQLAKLLPTSEHGEAINRAIYLDNVSERGGYIEGEGKVVEVPFETEEQKVDKVQDKKEQMRQKQANDQQNG